MKLPFLLPPDNEAINNPIKWLDFNTVSTRQSQLQQISQLLQLFCPPKNVNDRLNRPIDFQFRL
jgi:hypothetical protein